ncbi:VIT family protein [soil metagenome]
MPRAHRERHLVSRIGWLRAAVLGANDGILSTGSLIVGVAAAGSPRSAVLLTGIAGLVSGAMSMAAGEYVSVSSQADAETADRAREAEELILDPDGEHEELAGIYRGRGLDAELANAVAGQLMEKDALGAHLRDELGLHEDNVARPVQAAFASAGSFAAGAAVPLAMVLIAPETLLSEAVPAASILLLALLGAVGARAGGAPMLRASMRVTFWGALAMAITYGIGRLAGATL